MFSEESDFLFWINIADFSASYMQVRLQEGLLVLRSKCILYASIYGNLFCMFDANWIFFILELYLPVIKDMIELFVHQLFLKS